LIQRSRSQESIFHQLLIKGRDHAVRGDRLLAVRPAGAVAVTEDEKRSSSKQGLLTSMVFRIGFSERNMSATVIKGSSASENPSSLDLYLAAIESNLGKLRGQTTRLALAIAEAKSAMNSIPQTMLAPSENDAQSNDSASASSVELWSRQ